MAVYDFPDTAGQPTDGSFEYTSPDGTLYEWNGYAWVVPGDGTSGSSEFVKVVGDNMTGDLTLGTDKITLDAADGSATFGQNPLDNTDGKTGDYGAAFSGNGRLTLGRAKGATAFQIYNQTDPEAAVVLNSNGTATFAGDVTSSGKVASYIPTSSSTRTLFAGQSDVGGTKSLVYYVTSNGAATFAGSVVSGDYDGGVGARFANGAVIAARNTFATPNTVSLNARAAATEYSILAYPTGSTDVPADLTFGVKIDGSATFASHIVVENQVKSNRTTANAVCFRGDLNNSPTTRIYADGSALFAGNIDADNVTFNLEADNSANYTTTTDSEGVETQVYNGPTLDMKEVGLALVALKSAAAAATDFTSLKSAIATSLANI